MSELLERRRKTPKNNISRGIIEFDRKVSATRAIEQVNNGCFFLTKSPRAIVCAQIEAEDADDGLREVNVLYSISTRARFHC